MADATYAELYAQSRRDRNAGGAPRRAQDGAAPKSCISLFPCGAESGIFQCITQDITNYRETN